MKKLNKTLVSLTVASLFFASNFANAASPSTCEQCHGPDGLSNYDQFPNLKGQKKGYIIKQLKAFALGERKNALMQSQAGLLSEEDMEALAEHFSSL